MSHLAAASANPMNRRRFIQIGVASAVAFGGMAGLARTLNGGYRKRLQGTERPIGLSTKEFIVMRSLVEAIHPGEEGFPSGLSMGVHQRLDQEVWAASPGLQADLKQALQVLEHLPPALGHWGRFSELDPEKRIVVLEKMMQSDLDLFAQLAGGFKELVHFFYYNRPEVWLTMKYEGPFVQKRIPAASEVAYLELLKSSPSLVPSSVTSPRSS